MAELEEWVYQIQFLALLCSMGVAEAAEHGAELVVLEVPGLGQMVPLLVRRVPLLRQIGVLVVEVALMPEAMVVLEVLES
jgi:hypothetical protein